MLREANKNKTIENKEKNGRYSSTVYDNKNDFVEETLKYSKHYSQNSFWNKLSTHYKSVSSSLLEATVSLYYSLRDEDTPKWARRVIVGALGYFIFPVDLLPDFIPVLGYSDDAAVVLSALATVALYIKPIHKEKAKDKIKNIFNFANKK